MFVEKIVLRIKKLKTVQLEIQIKQRSHKIDDDYIYETTDILFLTRILFRLGYFL